MREKREKKEPKKAQIARRRALVYADFIDRIRRNPEARKAQILDDMAVSHGVSLRTIQDDLIAQRKIKKSLKNIDN